MVIISLAKLFLCDGEVLDHIDDFAHVLDIDAIEPALDDVVIDLVHELMADGADLVDHGASPTLQPRSS